MPLRASDLHPVGASVQDIDSSVRKDVEEPSYLPDKEDIHIIYSREEEVNSRKGTWLEHFASIYNRVLEEDTGISGEVGSQ